LWVKSNQIVNEPTTTIATTHLQLLHNAVTLFCFFFFSVFHSLIFINFCFLYCFWSYFILFLIPHTSQTSFIVKTCDFESDLCLFVSVLFVLFLPLFDYPPLHGTMQLTAADLLLKIFSFRNLHCLLIVNCVSCLLLSIFMSSISKISAPYYVLHSHLLQQTLPICLILKTSLAPLPKLVTLFKLLAHPAKPMFSYYLCVCVN